MTHTATIPHHDASSPQKKGLFQGNAHEVRNLRSKNNKVAQELSRNRKRSRRSRLSRNRKGTGTVGTVCPETKTGTGTVGTVFHILGCHEVFPLNFHQLCCAEAWDFWAEVFAEVFAAPNVPAKKARKLRQKLRAKLRQNRRNRNRRNRNRNRSNRSTRKR